jgi:hypothetical protein
MYVPPAPGAALSYDGAPLAYQGSIPASFGVDLIEVSLDGRAHDQPVEIRLSSEGARLDVQVWRLSGAGAEMRGLTPQPERLAGDCSAGCGHSFSSQDLAQADRLALIVVRLDRNEAQDGVGAYSLRIRG